MLTEDVRALLEAGSALIVGLTRPDGLPHATRGYGLSLDPDATTATLLVGATESTTLALAPGAEPRVPIAVTAADVLTLASVQVKGVLLGVEAAGPEDLARKDRYCDEFCAAIQRVDGISAELAERWRPQAVIRWRMTIDELFVQTPGPGAGARIEIEAR